MGRGLLSGVSWGALVGGLVLALSSQLTDRREVVLPAPNIAAADAPVSVPADGTASPESEAAAAEPQASDAAPAVASPPPTGTSDVAVAASDAPLAAPTETPPSAPAAVTPPESGPEAGSGQVAQPIAPSVPDAPDVSVSQSDAGTGDQVAVALPSQSTDAPPAGGSDVPTTPATDPSATGAPEGLSAPDAGSAALGDTGLPQPGFQSTPSVTTNRLVSIGDGDETETAATEASTEVDPDAPALVRFAAPFENPDREPMVSVVLLHEGGAAPGEATGLDLPVNVTFAVRADDPAASSIAAAYRAAGREVVLVPTLPPGATPADVEVALQANFDAVPEAVAVMDAPETGFQSERTAITQVVSVLADEGRGLVTFPRGLNTAQQLAERVDLPARLVFRQLDEGGEGEDVIRRTLDRAAFRARQEGVVILVGRTRPETVSAILGWAVDNAVTNVKLAPISAALLAE